MRRVDARAEFSDALASARAEASAAFGDDRVLIEKYVNTPRHIEVQVFGDGTRAVHLFERDCSLQRRHQKVIEEAPAPGMTDAMRAAMGEAAVRAAEAIGYRSAGTVEFIADASDGLDPERFYFMEMNTRLQVEHPVTEAVTGVDLVEWMLRVAAGERLWMSQDDLAIDGHAFEARLYAEDPANEFLPATGTLTHLHFPHWARAETGVRAGDAISPFYDPMIAKVIVHGSTRGAALRALDRALAETQVAGTVTNLAFLRALARHDGIARGEVDTGLIAREGDLLTGIPIPCSRTRALAGLAALGLDRRQPHEGFHLWAPLVWTQTLRWRGEEVVVRVEAAGGGVFRAAIGDAVHDVARDGDRWRIDGSPVDATLARGDGHVHVFWGNAYTFEVPDPLAVGTAAVGGSGTIEAPMPGLVKAVFVKAGEAVAQGERLAILEAMKMEHALRAPADGTVAEVLVAEGAQVEAGAALVRMEDA